MVVGQGKPSYGQYVVVDHGNGESSLYAHLDSVLVTVGQVVQAGTQLGTVGDTGNSSGPHLHFEERVGGAIVDSWFHGSRFPMNSSQASKNCGTVAVTDIPLAGDMYGGRSAEVMVYRKSAPAAFHVTRTGAKERVIKLGRGTAQPVLGDWDGDGRVNPGIREPASRLFTMQVKRSKTTVKFGKSGDLPIAGNWDGNGTWEIGVRRPGSAKFLLRMPDGSIQKVALGDANDLPVTGDWDGNGVTDLGVYDQATATFTLLQKDPMGAPFTTVVPFGTPGDVPGHRRLGRQRHHRPRRLDPLHRDVQQARRRGPDERGRPGQEGPVRPARRRAELGALSSVGRRPGTCWSRSRPASPTRR